MRHFREDDFCFQSFQIAMPKQKAESELLGDKSRQKAAHQTFREEYMYRKVFVHCMIAQSTQPIP